MDSGGCAASRTFKPCVISCLRNECGNVCVKLHAGLGVVNDQSVGFGAAWSLLAVDKHGHGVHCFTQASSALSMSSESGRGRC